MTDLPTLIAEPEEECVLCGGSGSLPIVEHNGVIGWGSTIAWRSTRYADCPLCAERQAEQEATGKGDK